MNNKLTLLVTLKDRFEFTIRLCNYLECIQFPFSIFFADGSLEDDHVLFFEDFLKKTRLKITYKRYPPDKILLDYYNKCKQAINEITTPYVMLADNDDFPIIQGLTDALNFLELNKDFVGCNGRVSGVVAFPKVSAVQSNFLFFLPYYCHSMDVPVLLNQETAGERIDAYLKNFYSIFYSVFRTESLQYTFSQISKENFSALGIFELFLSYMQLAQGKVQSLPLISYIRQKGSSQTAVTQKDWMDHLFYTNWLHELKMAITHVSKFVSERENIDFKFLYDNLYDRFVKKQKTRYIVKKFYFFKNANLFFNKENLTNIFLFKIAKISPFLSKKISRILIKKYTFNDVEIDIICDRIVEE